MERTEKKRVLMVEDEAELSEIILQMLNSFGYEGSTVNCARSALKKIEHSEYDLLLIDLTLPDKSGTLLYQDIIKVKPRYRGKVVFTSGMEVSDELTELMEQDGLCFLPKPFSLDDFRSILRQLS